MGRQAFIGESRCDGMARAVLIATVMTVVQGGGTGGILWGSDASALTFVPLGETCRITALVTPGPHRRRPHVHKRLMPLATLEG
jgi:hypothetical protein